MEVSAEPRSRLLQVTLLAQLTLCGWKMSEMREYCSMCANTTLKVLVRYVSRTHATTSLPEVCLELTFSTKKIGWGFPISRPSLPITRKICPGYYVQQAFSIALFLSCLSKNHL